MDDWARFFEDNRVMWDASVPVHAASRFYDLEGFKAGANTLRTIERERVGDVRGKRLLHLQCHFGMDTLSWARLGAEVTGVDFSPAGIGLARSLAAELSLPARFVECNGRFVIVAWHPYVWMSQIGPDLAIRYSYFNRGAISEEGTGTYADRTAPLRYREHGWNHPLCDVVNALIGAGLRIDRLDEYDHSNRDIFPGLVTKGADDGYRFTGLEGMIPMMFSVEASRPI